MPRTVADEVITGFGRTGAWFASTRWGLEPDLITCAKGLTSGYLPMGAVVASPRIAEPFWKPGAGLFRHGYTYSGHPLATAAAEATLDVYEEEGLFVRAKELAPYSGQYELAPKMIITIDVRNNTLFAQLTGQEPAPVS